MTTNRMNPVDTIIALYNAALSLNSMASNHYGCRDAVWAPIACPVDDALYAAVLAYVGLSVALGERVCEQIRSSYGDPLDSARLDRIITEVGAELDAELAERGAL